MEAGARYIQTQGLFDLESFKRFMDEVDKANIKTHIMAGIIPLKAAGMAKYMNENVPGIAVPQDMIDRLAAAAAEGKAKGVKGLRTYYGNRCGEECSEDSGEGRDFHRLSSCIFQGSLL